MQYSTTAREAGPSAGKVVTSGTRVPALSAPTSHAPNMEAKFNLRNPAVKRIMQEMKEMQNDTSCDFIAEALEADIFEWHFVIRGPPDTEFEGGVYHGRILLPAEYPFMPPAFMMLTPSGRFETSMKICLSISSHHPEHWQPSWSDFTKEERKKLAVRARNEVPTFGSAERQRLNQDMHQRMLQRMAAGVASTSKRTEDDAGAPQQQQQQQQPQEQQGGEEAEQAVGTPERPPPHSGALVPEPATPPQAPSAAATVHATASPAAPAPAAAQQVLAQGQGQGQGQARQGSQSADQGLTLLAIALSIGIAAILLRKVLAAFRAGDMDSMF